MFLGAIPCLEGSGLAESRRFVYKIIITGGTASAGALAGTTADHAVADHIVEIAPGRPLA